LLSYPQDYGWVFRILVRLRQVHASQEIVFQDLFVRNLQWRLFNFQLEHLSNLFKRGSLYFDLKKGLLRGLKTEAKEGNYAKTFLWFTFSLLIRLFFFHLFCHLLCVSHSCRSLKNHDRVEGKERKGKERKGKERKGKERKEKRKREKGRKFH